MKRQLRLSLRLGVVLGLAVVLGGPSPSALAQSATIWVNDDNGPWLPPGHSCEHPGFQTIQAAVTAAPSGSRINVCPGTYTEQVTIPSGKNNLTLRSVNLWQAIVRAPALMLDPKAIVRVNGAQNTTILAFTISGPGGTACDSLRYGVRVDGGGSANILGNHITHIRDSLPPPAVSGCQNGVGILAGRVSEATTGSANVLGNVVDDYQKGGVVISNASSSGNVVANRVIGIGPTATIAQNGIQVSSNATATVRHNIVAENIYTPQTFASAGILLFQAGSVDVDHNSVARSDAGVYAFLSTAQADVDHNRVQTSTFDGVIVDMVSNHTVAYNAIDENTGPGIGVYDGATSNSLDKNHIEHNDGGGVVFDDGDSNLVRGNHVRYNGTSGGDTTDGLRLSALSTGNTLQLNFMRSNTTHDCHDDSTGSGTAGTANFWLNDKGDTQNRPGLCRPGDADEDSDDRTQSAQVAMAAGWDPSYAWYTVDSLATEYAWTTAYSTVDTQSLLQLVAALGLPREKPAASPAQ